MKDYRTTLQKGSHKYDDKIKKKEYFYKGEQHKKCNLLRYALKPLFGCQENKGNNFSNFAQWLILSSLLFLYFLKNQTCWRKWRRAKPWQQKESSLHSYRREFHQNPKRKDRSFPLRLLTTQSRSSPLSPPAQRDDNGFFVTASGTVPRVIVLTFFLRHGCNLWSLGDYRLPVNRLLRCVGFGNGISIILNNISISP